MYGHTWRNPLAFFRADRRLDDIAPGDADAFRVFLKANEGLAENTVRRRMGIAKQFFRAAVRRKLIGESPFGGQPTTVREDPKRFHFVSREEAQAVQKAVHDPVQQASAQSRTESQRERPGTEEAPVCGAAQSNAAPCESTGPHPVGRSGLEPLTSCVSSRRSSHLS